MTRAALTKLLILVVLAFIICLPEFFTLYRASKVNFLCPPYQPCNRSNRVTGQNGRIGDSEIRRKEKCDPSQTAGHEKLEQACTQENQSMVDAGTDSRGGGEESEKSWFICQTDKDMAELKRNLSSSALPFEVSVELQFKDTETLNLTLYSLGNHSSLHLHPPKEEDGEEEGLSKDDGRQTKAFYCCLSVLPASGSAGQSQCLLWFTNHTVLLSMAKEQLLWKMPLKDEWRCVYRVFWLVLLCVVLLTIVTTVFGQICLCRKPKVPPYGSIFTSQRLNDGERFTDTNTPNGMILHLSGTQSWSELSAIQEVDSQGDIETLLDGNVDQCYTANLHHRSHHATSSLTEDQTL